MDVMSLITLKEIACRHRARPNDLASAESRVGRGSIIARQPADLHRRQSLEILRCKARGLMRVMPNSRTITL